jgi:hypothetical protein
MGGTDEEFKYFVLEIHYDNPELRSGNFIYFKQIFNLF